MVHDVEIHTAESGVMAMSTRLDRWAEVENRHALQCGKSWALAIPVLVNSLIPDGVFCVVPKGGDLRDPDVKVGAISDLHRKAAEGFANMLRAYQADRRASIPFNRFHMQ
ncbi:hypothetical protein [Maricaulis maris]|uniref:Uncharacterized protein n=1 Tax=Maricaulis maris TaxID=74318 RepID=A0A495DMW2_9PROT|nr:hypothetical protein [Maricaulis maris]RKR03601.1 hypothetical protein C7435_0037 [Maricaulis maris]